MRGRTKQKLEPLPSIRKPPLNQFMETLWFPGLDPATKVDYFGLTIHGLNPRPADGSAWMPFLRGTWQIQHKSYTDLIQWLRHEVFEAMPPTHGIMDSTTDIMVAQEIERVFGSTMINTRAMSNTGNWQLKQVGWRYLQDGYRFPNTAKMKDREMAQNIKDLKVQCLEQYMVRTPGQKISFVHPPKKHDDLNRSWEMSLLAVYEFQQGSIGLKEGDYGENEEDDYRDSKSPTLIDDGLPGGSFALPFQSDPLSQI